MPPSRLFVSAGAQRALASRCAVYLSLGYPLSFGSIIRCLRRFQPWHWVARLFSLGRSLLTSFSSTRRYSWLPCSFAYSSSASPSPHVVPLSNSSLSCSPPLKPPTNVPVQLFRCHRIHPKCRSSLVSAASAIILPYQSQPQLFLLQVYHHTCASLYATCDPQPREIYSSWRSLELNDSSCAHCLFQRASYQCGGTPVVLDVLNTANGNFFDSLRVSPSSSHMISIAELADKLAPCSTDNAFIQLAFLQSAQFFPMIAQPSRQAMNVAEDAIESKPEKVLEDVKRAILARALDPRRIDVFLWPRTR
jgi:hypothetical protein